MLLESRPVEREGRPGVAAVIVRVLVVGVAFVVFLRNR